MTIEVNNYKISYETFGDTANPALVVLQGWGTTYPVYNSIAEFLKDKYYVVLFDLPGFGKSTEPREPWNVDAYCDFFEEFLKALGIKKAILMGHSYGGRMIIKLANRESLSFEIEKIIMVDAAGVPAKKTPAQERKIKRYKLLKKLFDKKWIYALFPELIDDWKSKQGSADYRAASDMMKKCMAMALNDDLTSLLKGVKPETLLVWGANDTATPLSDGELMEKEMPNAGLAVIQNAGHYSFLDQPVIFRNILGAYLK